MFCEGFPLGSAYISSYIPPLVTIQIQYGNKKDVGTEHLILTLIDRIRKLLEDPKTAVVILSSYEWKCAFERIDPTLVALKMIKLGIRSSIVKLGINFLRERKMLMKMNGHISPSFDLIGEVRNAA